jgi:glycosyltransferase involved in cell wall biosynthesis
VFEEAAYLRRAGYATRIVALQYDPEVTFDGTYTDEVTSLRSGHDVASFLPAMVRLGSWLRRERPDLVVAMSVVDSAFLRIPAWLAKVPYVSHVLGTVFWFHTDRTKYAGINRRALREVLARSPFHSQFVPATPPRLSFVEKLWLEALARLYRFAARGARGLLTLSRRTAWEAEQLYGKPAREGKGAFPPSLLTYEPRTDPFARLDLGAGPIVLNVNRLEPRKRVDLAIRCFAEVLRDMPNAHLVIGGLGESEAGLRALASDLGIADRVRFVGFIPESALWDWIAHCDVFIHPNWAEFAIAPYEALALGRKVVWSSEMELDPPIEATGLVYAADPTVESMSRALRAALAAGPPEPGARAPMAAYVWDRYFAVVEEVVADAIRQG